MMEMTPAETAAYYRQVDRVNAHEYLELMRVTCAPHMTDAARRELVEELSRRADGRDGTRLVIAPGDNDALQRFMQSAGR